MFLRSKPSRARLSPSIEVAEAGVLVQCAFLHQSLHRELPRQRRLISSASQRADAWARPARVGHERMRAPLVVQREEVRGVWPARRGVGSWGGDDYFIRLDQVDLLLSLKRAENQLSVGMIPTNEEMMIASHTLACIRP
jgi:hypothetical protein